MRRLLTVLLSAALALSVSVEVALAQESVNESARDLPVAYDVDVVVVGGGTGAVSAALAAADQGASVFLAAPHPYLGDDMTATLRLWLEPGEVPTSPLAKRLFDDPSIARTPPNRLPFTYAASIAPSPRHRDTDPPSRLRDGQWSVDSKHSVQFDDSVIIVCDLGKPQEIRKVCLRVFRRLQAEPDELGFDTGRTLVSISDDGRSWHALGLARDDHPTSKLAAMSIETEATARHVRLAIDVADSYQRMLLGEIEVFGIVGVRVSLGSERT